MYTQVSEVREHSIVIRLFHSGSSTVTCAQCRECPDGWTGTETCTGTVCFVQTGGETVDRGCFSTNALISYWCNQTTIESDGIPTYRWCCNDTDFCNSNVSVSFPIQTSSNTPPTITPASSSTGRDPLLITPSTNASSSTGMYHIHH